VVVVGALLPLSGLASPTASANVTVTSHFIWTATSSNTSSFVSILNNAATNGLPNAMLFVTPNLSPGGICTCVMDTSQVGVAYNLFGNGRWAIVNEDESNIPIGAAFNVLVVQKSSADVFVQTATLSNIGAGRTIINSIATNGKANAQLLITPNYDPGGKNGVVNNHVVGVIYSSSTKKWGVFNQDEGSMPKGAHFNVMVGSTMSNGGKEILLRSSSANIVGDSTLVNNPQSTGNPNSVLFESPNFDPGGVGGIFDPAATGVLYYQSPTDRAAVFNEDTSSMPLGAAFNVLIYPS
jgi:hypothetical protein